MDIEVKVDKEAVERAVSAAIVQSAIGEEITKVANALMKDAMAVGSYGKPDGVLRRVGRTAMTDGVTIYSAWSSKPFTDERSLLDALRALAKEVGCE